MNSPLIRLIAAAILLAGFSPSFSLCAADAPLQTLEEQIAALKKENAALKRENQQLRGLLTAAPTKPVPTTSPTITIPAAAETAKPADTSATHWLSSTGKRHNSRCRYFQTSKGTGCSSTQGIACKICGG